MVEYIRMPGKSGIECGVAIGFRDIMLRDELKADVQELAGKIGERNLSRYPRLIAAAEFIGEIISASWSPTAA